MTGGFLSRGLEEHDWQIPVTPGQEHGDSAYDVIVIGSGLGGLACAALLSHWGYRTLLLENHGQVGGYYSSFERNGFRFNTGAMEVTGLWDGGPFDLLLQDLGLEKDDYFATNSYKYRLGPWQLEPFRNLEGLIVQLVGLFPTEVHAIRSFFDDAQLAHDQWFQDGSLYGTPPPPELLARLLGAEALQEDRIRRLRYFDWLSKSWGQKLDDHFEADGVRTLLDFLLNHMHIDPYRTPAEVALRDVGFLRFGSFYPKGGAQKLSDALRDAIRDHGGSVLLGRRADEVLTEGGRITGVRAGNDLFCSDIVVSNSCVKNTILDLVDPASLPGDYRSAVQEIQMQESYFLAFLGVDLDLRGYPTMTQVLDIENDDFFLLTINSSADASYAPEGMASVTIIAPAQYDDYPPRESPAYQRVKGTWTRRLVEQASGVIPGLADHIVAQDAATPRTLERYTLAPRGSGEGIAWSAEALLPWFRTPVEGLYLVGSSTYPGAGAELALMSGMICANDIDGWRPRHARAARPLSGRSS